MSEMIERVARAICIADGVDPDAEGCGLGAQMPKDERYPLWRAREKQARAAIEAMREPTEEMAAIGHDRGWSGVIEGCHALEAEAAAGLWSDMIDEALKEGT